VISGDASAVLFLSSAPILPDSPSSLQAYLRRFPSGETIAASRSANGSYANDDLLSLQVDRTGRRVAFLSESTNLGTPLDAWRDFFIVDTLTGTIEIANTNANDEPANATIGSIAMSADGRFATFRSPATNLASPSSPSSVIYRKDLLTGEVITVSIGAIGTPNGGSVAGSAVSSDGGVVAFGSEASDLVPADFNDEVDVFARPMPASRAGDINGDAMIGAEDLAELLAAWGSSDYWADLARDGAVGPSDLALLLGSWTPAADR
jgi:hypothetical protein